MNRFVKNVQKVWTYGAGRTALAAFCAHSVSISIGICQGYSAILIPQITNDFKITSEESSWLASLGAVTNPLGAVLSGILAEYVGRRRSILLSNIPFIIGWLCIATAKDISSLYAGRLITGIAAGMSVASYTYVAEVATAEHRGFFQSLGPICASFGILLTYTLGLFVKWNIVALISVTFAIFTMVTIELVPESPAYLIKKNRKTDGLDSLIWFRRSNATAQEELNRCETPTEEIPLRDVCLSPTVVKPFFILVTLFLLQELSGIYSILFYAVNFFRDADLEVDEHVSSIIVGLIRFIMSIAAAILINRFGRKLLCIVSSGGMAVTMFVAAAYFKYYEVFPSYDKEFTVLPLMCVLSNVFFSMVGMLPIPWILVSELFPLRVRPVMGGFVICIAQCFIFICVKIYYDLIALLDFSGTLWTFCCASALGLIFCKYVVPETKDKSLEDIEKHFTRATSNTIKIYSITTNNIYV